MKGNEYGGDVQVGRMEVIKRDRGLKFRCSHRTQTPISVRATLMKADVQPLAAGGLNMRQRSPRQ